MPTPDYYRILGVAPYSEDVVIQAAYRALMRRYHPDTNKSGDAVRRATEINEAYAVLSDPARKARYDAERKAARAKSRGASGSTSQSRHSPPPPPPPPRSSSFATSQPSSAPTDWRAVGITFGIIGGFLLLSSLVASSESSESGSEANYVVENLTAENLVVEDDFVTEVNLPAPPTLARIPQAPIQYGDVESAAAKFAQVLTKSGMSGARSLSEKCHAGVVAKPAWSSADWCAAFDYAAAYVDAEVSRAGGWKPMPYFQFQADNQPDRYREAGAADYSVSTRLHSIKRAAEAAAEDAVRQRVAESKSSDREDTPNTTPAGGVENSSRAGSASGSTFPSFDCAKASRISEKTICSDPVLAELDRNMAIQYYQALRDATSEQRSLLERTGRRFISYRDRCPGAACISQTYFNRMREIQDIKERRWRG